MATIGEFWQKWKNNMVANNIDDKELKLKYETIKFLLGSGFLASKKSREKFNSVDVLLDLLEEGCISILKLWELYEPEIFLQAKSAILKELEKKP